MAAEDELEECIRKMVICLIEDLNGIIALVSPFNHVGILCA
jgi:hypothetical protein